MRVKYKILDYRPDAEWIAVEFNNPNTRDSDPWIEQFSFPDFSAEKLTDHLMAVASRIAGSWERIPNHPEELGIPLEGTLEIEPELYLPYEPNPQYEEEPEWDEWTQELLPGDITSPTQETIPWVVRDLTPEEQTQRLENAAAAWRWDRNNALIASDFIYAPDAPRVGTMEEWTEYRQALRDITKQPNFPKEVDWPKRPDIE